MRDIMDWIMTTTRPDILQIPDWVLGRWARLPHPWGLVGHMRHPYGHRPATSGLSIFNDEEHPPSIVFPLP
jgi:hypothetical protein